jgi:hypothetical protein
MDKEGVIRRGQGRTKGGHSYYNKVESGIPIELNTGIGRYRLLCLPVLEAKTWGYVHTNVSSLRNISDRN